jgi:hypothetical protein
MSRAQKLALTASVILAATAPTAFANVVATPPAPATETIVIPEVLEKPGYANVVGGMDTTITMVLGADYRGLVPGGSAAGLVRSEEDVHLYLFEKRTSPAGARERLAVNDQGTPICNPCTVKLGGRQPMKRIIHVERLIRDANGGQWLGDAGLGVFQGYVVLKASGNLYDVAVQADTVSALNDGTGLRFTQLAVERLP